MNGEVDREEVAREAKALVALAFRNGPIEDIHAGPPCPTRADDRVFSRISEEEMKAIMKYAVNRLCAMLILKLDSPEEYKRQIQFGHMYTLKVG